jgi:small-conductance mechanosensitive channel
VTRSRRRPGWVVAIASGVIAVAALVAGSNFGAVSGTLHKKLVVWISVGVLLVFGVVSTSRTATCLSRGIAARSLPSAAGAVRVVTAAVGYLFVIFAVLAVLKVDVEHLLVAAGLVGIVLGIAAQQSLGNVFAGVVLMLARPFSVGDHVRVRSGALGGTFDAWVHEMSLTYVTLRTDDGDLKVPNSAMLAAGVGRLPKQGTAPSAQVPPAAAPNETPSPGPGTATATDGSGAKQDATPR